MGPALAVSFHMDDFFEQSQSVDPLHERFVVVGLCHEHIAHAGERIASMVGCFAVEAVGDNDEGEPGMSLSDLFEEPLCRIRLAVLLLLAVRCSLPLPGQKG